MIGDRRRAARSSQEILSNVWTDAPGVVQYLDMTTRQTQENAMTRSEIRDTAKQIVLSHGPSNAQEFLDELLAQWGQAGNDALAAEVNLQAERVYDFFGPCPNTVWDGAAR